LKTAGKSKTREGRFPQYFLARFHIAKKNLGDFSTARPLAGKTTASESFLREIKKDLFCFKIKKKMS
jgi:hypothetical protein